MAYSSSPRMRGRLSIVLAAGLAMGLAACDRDNASDTALREAQNSLTTVSPAEATYTKVLTSLQSVASDGAPSQKAAASGLMAQAHAGLAEGPSATVNAVEQATLDAIVQLRALHSQFLTYSAMADAAGAYDPSTELAEVDRQAAERDGELAALQQKKSDLDAEIQKLKGQAKQLLDQAQAKRAEAATLKGQVANQTAVRGEELMIQARERDREADALEVQSATLEARAAKVQPDSDQAQLDIERVNQQTTLLAETREQINARATASRAQSAESRAAAQKVAAEIETLVDETSKLREGSLATAAEEAANRFQQAAAAAQQSVQGGSASAGNMAAGAHHQSLGDLYWSRAQGLAAWSQVLSGLTQSKPAVPGDFKAAADAAAAQSKELLDKATESYEAANAAYQDALSSGAGGEEAQRRIDRLNQLLAQSVKTTSNGSKDIRVQPMMPEPSGEGAAVVDGGGATGAVAPGTTPNETLAALKTASANSDPAVADLFLTENDEQRQIVQAMLSLMPAGKRVEQALVAKFGDEAGEALKQMQQQGGSGALAGVEDIDPASVEFQIDGYTATATVGGEPMTMKQVDGVWKIDLSAAGLDGPAGQMMVQMAPKISGIMDEFAGEVESGKYSTLQEAMAMFMQKMMQSMMPQNP